MDEGLGSIFTGSNPGYKMKAVVFDFGGTLATNGLPASWECLYRDALVSVLQALGLEFNSDNIETGKKVLLKYNTRVNDREVEVDSDTIFKELFQRWGVKETTQLKTAEDIFFSFFLKNTFLFPETQQVLKTLKQRHIKIGVLSDVAYGADKHYLLSGLSQVAEYIDYFLTSAEIGFRKPNPKGYLQILKQFAVDAEDSLFVGDEKKDISGANRVGMSSVLVNRTDKPLDYSQKYTVNSLSGILHYL